MTDTVRIAVVLVDRANYGRLKPVMHELADRPGVDLQVVCAGTMLLDRFGRAVELVIADGFTVYDRVYLEVEGSVPNTMAKSIGIGVIEFSNTFLRLKPDFVLIIGDRYEALAAAVAAAVQNLCIVHLQGGEVSGSIDESSRHAITKLSHYHFPSTERAAKYVVDMGEDPASVFPLGCPSADVVHAAMNHVPREELDRLGVGPSIDLSQPYLLSVFHPVTTEYRDAEAQMDVILQALKRMGMQSVLLWPNIDAGSDGVSQSIRRLREFDRDMPLHVYKNFEPEVYIPILGHAACAVGNSSSFVRDASFLGTPVVLVGSRQDGREWCASVERVEPDAADVIGAIERQMDHGPYPPSDLYGRPGVSAAIADKLLTLEPYTQKRLHYVTRESSDDAGV